MRVLSRRFLVTRKEKCGHGEQSVLPAVYSTVPDSASSRRSPSGNVRGCAPVRFGDVVLQILKADAPQAAASNLNRTQFSTADQPPG